MKIIPQSIVARVVWLVALVGLLSFLLHVYVVIFLVRPMFHNMTSAVAGQVILVRSLVMQAATAPNPQDLQKYLPPNMRISSPVDSLEGVQAAPPRFAEVVMSPMREKLLESIRLSIPIESSIEMQKQLFFDFEHAGQNWRISYDVFPPAFVLLGSMLGWLALVALGISGSFYVGVRLVTRPMSEVAGRIATQGHRIQPLQQPKHAAQEVRAMVRAFNQLVEEVQSADKKKMQMLAGLSHDLRTPLTRLRLRAETRFQEPDAQAFEQDISAMQRMIDQFMAYVHGNTRASLGREESVVEQLSRLMSHYPENTHSLDIAFNDPSLSLPSLGLGRILTNLMDNALAYGTAPWEVKLHERIIEGVHFAVITVYDGGQGMTAAEFEIAKQPFVRLGDAQGVGHSGLGLAIASQIADQLNGRLSTHRRSDGRFGIEFAWPITRLKTNHSAWQFGSDDKHSSPENAPAPAPAPAPGSC
jgi:two-component system, OmpR family, osmolarity sensor histidine kinase EnvZ